MSSVNPSVEMLSVPKIGLISRGVPALLIQTPAEAPIPAIRSALTMNSPATREPSLLLMISSEFRVNRWPSISIMQVAAIATIMIAVEVINSIRVNPRLDITVPFN